MLLCWPNGRTSDGCCCDCCGSGYRRFVHFICHSYICRSCGDSKIGSRRQVCVMSGHTSTINLNRGLVQALTEHTAVAVTQSADGQLIYKQANEYMLQGMSKDINSWLPRQVWNEDPCTSHSHLAGSPQCTNTQCPICLEEFQNNDIVTRIKCLHYMHMQCALAWIQSRVRQGLTVTCPLCNCVAIALVYTVTITPIPTTPETSSSVFGQIRKYLVSLLQKCVSLVSPMHS